jgi:hypothetical protein
MDARGGRLLAGSDGKVRRRPSLVWHVIPIVTNRALRRTWKTLAGKAGIPKEIRDRIQNHALHDVSSRSYDRWHYLPEKRQVRKCGTSSSGECSLKTEARQPDNRF